MIPKIVKELLNKYNNLEISEAMDWYQQAVSISPKYNGKVDVDKFLREFFEYRFGDNYDYE